jgi:hypothetical protein
MQLMAWLWPALTVLAPVLVIGLYLTYVPRIIADADWSQLNLAHSEQDAIARMAQDVDGRIQFGIASALL